jgi:hypothetical protein
MKRKTMLAVVLSMAVAMGCGSDGPVVVGPPPVSFSGMFSGMVLEKSACGAAKAEQTVFMEWGVEQTGETITVTSPQLCGPFTAVADADKALVQKSACAPFVGGNEATITIGFETGWLLRGADSSLAVELLAAVNSVFRDGSTSNCTKHYSATLRKSP